MHLNLYPEVWRRNQTKNEKNGKTEMRTLRNGKAKFELWRRNSKEKKKMECEKWKPTKEKQQKNAVAAQQSKFLGNSVIHAWDVAPLTLL